jgi:hypothetical protein
VKHLLIFEKWIKEGVGDKYLTNNFPINPEFYDFEKKYKSYKSIENKEDIIFNDGKGLIIIKNPKSLKNFGNSVRGIIDNKGNLYLEQFSVITHDEMLKILIKLGLINNYDEYWHRKRPIGFISIQREKDQNLFLISESYLTMKPEDKRNYKHRFWLEIPKLEEVKPIFQKFLDKAKIKNPKLIFENKQIKN